MIDVFVSSNQKYPLLFLVNNHQGKCWLFESDSFVLDRSKGWKWICEFPNLVLASSFISALPEVCCGKVLENDLIESNAPYYIQFLNSPALGQRGFCVWDGAKETEVFTPVEGAQVYRRKEVHQLVERLNSRKGNLIRRAYPQPASWLENCPDWWRQE